MADSATPRAADPAALAASLGAPPPRTVAVAFSGGRDSTALLHATVLAAHALGLQVVALHIHHGLQPEADAWLAQAQSLVDGWAAQGWPVTLRHERLSGAPAAGESVEAWARQGRHAALQRLAQASGADLLLLGHHRRDQAETFLLQALRGAGVAGLSAMPAQQWRSGVCWARPWLDRPREAIDAYVAHHQLAYVDDPTNLSERFARNHLRHHVWPALRAQSAGAETALANAAAWAQEAAALQEEMAREDLERCAADGPLQLDAWLALSRVRRVNVLRAWLRAQGGAIAPATLVRRLIDEAPSASVARWHWGDRELRLYRRALTIAARSSSASSITAADAVANCVLAMSGPSPAYRARTEVAHAPATPTPPTHLHIDGPGAYPVPAWRGVLHVGAVTQGGVALSRLSNLELRPREGGEQFQTHARGVPRSLKKCWQTAGIPASQRGGPLIHAGGELLFVVGLGFDARRLDANDMAQMQLRWQPDAV